MPNNRKPRSRAPSDTDKAVGERVRELRTLNNMTLAELGSALGISHQQLQKYETGTNRLSAGMLAALADALRVEISDLFAREEGKSKSKETPLSKAQSECHRIVDRVESIDKLNRIAGVLKALAAD